MTNDQVIERLRDWPFMGKAMAKAVADHIELLVATNEALIAERDQAWKRAAHAEKMWGETEVKLTESEALLAKAVEDAEKYQYAFAAQSRKLQAVLHIEGVRTTLAAVAEPHKLTSSEAAYNEVKGGKDE